MALDLRSKFSSESLTQYEIGQSGTWRDHAMTAGAASLALLVVAAIAVLMGMV